MIFPIPILRSQPSVVCWGRSEAFRRLLLEIVHSKVNGRDGPI
jgi:hypothetical protein